MSEIKYIVKVEIKELWNSKSLNIEWNLDPDVNVLAGDNGSGKSTILDLIAGVFVNNYSHDTGRKAKSVKITFNDGKIASFENIKGSIAMLETRAKSNERIKKFLSKLKKQEGKNYSKIAAIEFAEFSYEQLGVEPIKLTEMLETISTFDQELKDLETLKKFSDNLRTELDWQLYLLQQKYYNYTSSTGTLAVEALLNENNENKEQVDDLKRQVTIQKAKQNLFFGIIDSLFSNTGKKINRKNSDLSFLKEDKIQVQFHQLSSGEKQILIILLSALIQADKPFIMIMDEPEISLHTDWQEDLITNIRKLNENVQIIIATHSPFIIAHGWVNKVFQVNKITTPN